MSVSKNNAGFSAPIDYFGCAVAGKTRVKNSALNKNFEVAELVGGTGEVVAADIYGGQSSPQCDYILEGTASSACFPALGSIVTYGTGTNTLKIMVSRVAVTTSPAEPPTITIQGETIGGAQTVSRTFALGITSYPDFKCRVQYLGNDITVSGGVVTSLSYEWNCNIIRNTLKGDTITACAVDGRLTVNCTVQCYQASEPTITAANYDIITPASPTRNDVSYAEYQFTLTKYLTVTEPGGATPSE